MKEVAPEIERMAREMLIANNADPDLLVQPGTPQIYGTPGGEVFMVVPGAEQPLWRFYINAATKFLDLAKKISAESVEKAA